MDLHIQDPRSISISETTLELLRQVTETLERLNAFRPLSPELALKLRETLLPDRVVASLNMEGIIATRRQTLTVMDAMRVQETIGHGEREIFNALRADEFVNDSVERGLVLSEQYVREINRLLLDDLRPDAGSYRAGPVKLPGARFEPPCSSAVPGLMADLIQQFPLSESLHPVLQASWLHDQLTLVHPFTDGNGRTARLLQDWALMRRGLLPIGIPPSKRDDYYSALEQADDGNWDELVEMLCFLQLTMAGKYQVLLDEAKSRTEWIARLSKAAAAKKTNARHKVYIVWRKRMENVALSFERAADELDASSQEIGATFKNFGMLEYSDWELLCKHGSAERTWLFSILFFAGGKPFYKSIAFMKRHVPLPRIDTFPPPRDAVGLFLTGTTLPEGPRPDFHRYGDPDIRLREILWQEETLCVYTQPDPENEWVLTHPPGLPAVVEEFFMDMFARKAGLGV